MFVYSAGNPYQQFDVYIKHFYFIGNGYKWLNFVI